MRTNLMGPALVLAMGCLLLLPETGAAQNGASGNMPFVLEKVRTDKKRFVGENMGLTKEEAAKFWPVYDDYQDELFLLRARMSRLILDYKGAQAQMTEETAGKLIDEYLELVSLEPKLRKAYLPKFRSAIPGVKVLRYYQIENKIHAALMYELAALIPLVKSDEKKGE